MKHLKNIFLAISLIIIFSFSNSTLAQDGLSIKAKTGNVISYKVEKYQKNSIIIQHKYYQSIVGEISVDLAHWTDPLTQFSPLYWDNGTKVNVTLKSGDTFSDQICNITTNSNTQKVYSKTIYKGQTTSCYDSTSQNVVAVANNRSYYQDLVKSYITNDHLDGNELSISTFSLFNFSNIILNFFFNKTFDIKTGFYTQQHAMAIFPNGTILSDIQISQTNNIFTIFEFSSPILSLIFVTVVILVYRLTKKN